ncbi:MAG: Rpn family recombination-promoting nuclease/putative transposase [Deltaproteobacteria bacterium]|nr:Rpn family recombination-promoting nuclease/putative transposase [Deltaproteobacteria bacterium]
MTPEHVPSPLADTVVTAMFKNSDAAGLGMESLVNAALADSESELIGKVTHLQSQHVHSNVGQKSWRTDVEAETDKREVVILESQLTKFAKTSKRSLIYCQTRLTDRTLPGGTLDQALADLPRVVMVNLLDFKLTPARQYFHEVLKPCLCKAPPEPLDDVFEVHHLLLPLFEQIEPDPDNPLHCWLTALLRAHRSNKLMGEVVDKDPILKKFRGADKGFAQIVDRHYTVASNPEERMRYESWMIERTLNQENIRALVNEGKAIAKAEGKAEGKAENQLEIAMAFFRRAQPGADLSAVARELKSLNIPEDIIRSARERASAERG